MRPRFIEAARRSQSDGSQAGLEAYPDEVATAGGSLTVKLARWVLLLATLLLASAAQAAEQVSDADEEVLRRAGLKTDNASLLAFLRQRVDAAAEVEKIPQLIRELGSDRFQAREAAARKLVEIGTPVIAALQHAKKSKEMEVARRAKDCLERISRNTQISLPLFVSRLLVRRRVEGAVEALLRYLPEESDSETVEEIWFGLDSLARKDGRVHPALVAALTDRAPQRRAVAACLVGRLGESKERASVRRLVNDPDPWVRLRAAQGLLAGNDKTGIPVLIDLLCDPTSELAWQAEELLHYVAGDKSPEETVGRGAGEGKRRCRYAWERWWHRAGHSIDLTKIEEGQLCPGLVLIGGGKKEGICLCGCDAKPRWSIACLGEPKIVQLLSGNRLLVGEYLEPNQNNKLLLPGWKIMEHRLDNEECVWQREGPSVEGCRRLVNGDTVIVTPLEVLTISANGAESKFRWSEPGRQQGRPSLQIEGGEPLLVHAVERGEGKPVDVSVVEVKTGLEKRRVRATEVVGNHYDVKALAGGSFFLLNNREDRLVEVNAQGRTVWKCPLPCTSFPSLLRNGHILVVSRDRVVEIDRAGTVLWEKIGSVSSVQPCLELVRLGFDSPSRKRENRDSISYRVQALKNSDPLVRQFSAEWLGNQGNKAETAIPSLIEALDDKDKETASKSWGALYKLGTATIPRLKKALRDERSRVRACAAGILGSLSESGNQEARKILPEVLALINDKCATVRWQVISSIRLMDLSAQEVVARLVSALDDTDPEVSSQAALQLGHMESRAERAVPALLKTLKGSDDQRSSDAALALGRIRCRDKDVVPALVAILKDTKKPKVSASAARALGQFGFKADPALPVLIEIISSSRGNALEETDTLNACLEALGEIGKGSDVVNTTLLRVFRDTKMPLQTRGIAAVALGKVRPVGKSTCRELAEVLQDNTAHFALVLQVERAFKGIGSDAKSALPILRKVSLDRTAKHAGTASRIIASIQQK